ncbi:MAG: hypothetical protein ACRC7D_01660 [Aeromonas popoffii]|uniref:hypothetical protein n=1 Tax=Aeromonas popoffii TaxID=70856 RepID=UPI003F2F52CF
MMNTEIKGKGYMSTRIVTDEKNNPIKIMETLYWECPETGCFFKSPEKRISQNFYGFEWERVQEKPDNAEYIGVYWKPSNIN